MGVHIIMSTPEELINSLAEQQLKTQRDRVSALESNDYYRPVDVVGTTSSPPTQGEMDGLLGTPLSYKSNMVGLIRDTVNGRQWIAFGETDTNDWYAVQAGSGADAPSDGFMYVRRNGAWVSGGFTFSNLIDINKTWNGSSPQTALSATNTWTPSSTVGSVFPVGLNVNQRFDTTHTPAGGAQIGQFLRVSNLNSGTINGRGLDIFYENLGTGSITSAINLNIRSIVNSGGGAVATGYGIHIESQTASGTNYAIFTNTGLVRFADRVSIGSVSGIQPAQLLIDQSSTTATIPVISLDQADLSEEFINFISTIGAGNPIDTAAIGTYYGKIRVAVNGTFKYIALYNT